MIPIMNSPSAKSEKSDLNLRNTEPIKSWKKDENRILRVGIIGAGLMGKWHSKTVEKAGGKIVGLADPDIRRAKSLAAHFTGAESFDSAEEMLKKIPLDVAHICSPTSGHFIIAEFAVKSGVHLLIEKPIAPTAAETVKLFDAAAENDVYICPAHQFAYQQCAEKAIKMLPKIGKLLHLEAAICSAGGENLSAEFGNAVAFDILPHPLSVFQLFLSALLPEENWTVFCPQPGELRIGGQYQDTSLSIFVSLNARPTNNSFQIIGTNGTIHLDFFHDFIVSESGKASKRRKILRPFDLSVKTFSAAAFNIVRRTARFETAYPGLQNLTGKFYESIRKNEVSPISPPQAINVATIRDLLIKGAAEGGINKI